MKNADAFRNLSTRLSANPRSNPGYRFTGYRKFLDPDGYPAVVPPWGTLNAIDLNTGKYLWKIPLGNYPALAAQGMSDTGSENYGGPILTASGLLFLAQRSVIARFGRSTRTPENCCGRQTPRLPGTQLHAPT